MQRTASKDTRQDINGSSSIGRLIMNSSQKKYCVRVTDHYKDRFRERVARSKRIELFATEAFYLGEKPKGLNDSRLRGRLEKLENCYGDNYILKTHKGFVHVFDSAENVAVTVYKMPKLKPAVSRF